ncbi:hypothetical protein [Kitasatospora sp. NPDC018619]|uniref:hypothetical protein n=1 Tax=unclassified Kitasatospora TaxID=2633591 RepID=UPI00379FAE96
MRKVYSLDVEGVPRTVYTVVAPRGLQGEYRVVVRRGGEPAEDRVTLDMEKVADPVRC